MCDGQAIAPLRARMFSRFLVVGSIGFGTDLAVTCGLIATGWHPLAARPPAMLVAMAVTWWCNRRWTFTVQAPASAAELLRYAAVALLGSGINMGVYSGLVGLLGVAPALALVAGSAVQILASFVGYRDFAFTGRHVPVAVGSSGPAAAPPEEQFHAEVAPARSPPTRRAPR